MYEIQLKKPIVRLMKTAILSIILLNSAINLAAWPEKMLFCYKFKPGEYLTYKTHRQHTVTVNNQTQSMAREIRTEMLETLKIQESAMNVHHALTYQLDSIHVTPEQLNPAIKEMLLFQFPGQFTDSLIQMSTNGYPLDEHFQFNPLILPLSEFPLELNESWEFEFQIPQEPSNLNPCKSVVFGNGLLYDYIMEGSKLIARFVIHTTQLFEGECLVLENSVRKMVKREGEISGTHLVYFDEEHGMITKILTEYITRENRDTASGSLSLLIKSKSSTELVDWDYYSSL